MPDELRLLAPDLWHAESTARVAPGVHFPVRMLVVRLNGERLVLVSPLSLNDSLQGQLDRLGVVSDVIAPNAFHYRGLPEVYRRYPKAQHWASDALPSAHRAHPRTRSLYEISLPAELEVVPLPGSGRVGEYVIVHRPSASAYAADLLFNMHQPSGALTKLMLSLTGARDRLAVSRLMRSLIADPSALAQALQPLLTPDLARWIVGHGEIIDRDPAGETQSALRRAGLPVGESAANLLAQTG